MKSILEVRWPFVLLCVALVAALGGCVGASQVQPEAAQASSAAEPTLEQRMIKYQDTLAKDPGNLEAQYQMGNVYFDMGDYSEAVDWYQKVLETDPNHVPARANLAGVLQEMGDLDGAIAEYQRVLEKTPNDARAHSNLGNALYVNGRFSEAVDEFRRALTLDPVNAHAHYNLGVAFGDEGYYEEALVEWRKVMEVAPGTPVAEAAARNIQGIERVRETNEAPPKQ